MAIHIGASEVAALTGRSPRTTAEEAVDTVRRRGGRPPALAGGELRRGMTTARGVRWTLCGAAEAVDDEQVVVAVHREQRLEGRVPDDEVAGLLACMYMARVPRAIQRERCGMTVQEHTVEFDPLEWAAIAEELCALVDLRLAPGGPV
jgi:hypothetical protein